jgi:hypothetical protein
LNLRLKLRLKGESGGTLNFRNMEDEDLKNGMMLLLAFVVVAFTMIFLMTLLPTPTEEEKREYKRTNPDKVEVLTVDGDTVLIDGYYGPDGGRILRLKK